MKWSWKICLAVLWMLTNSACAIAETLWVAEPTPARTYYESLDLSTPEKSLETFLEGFRRQVGGQRWTYDLGVRVSLISHDTRFEAEPEGAFFVGAFAGVDYHAGSWRLGPRIAVGVWSEPNHGLAPAIHVMPINVRLGI